jgi:hypothetical protein
MLYERLLKSLKEAKSNLEHLITQGQVNDYAEYKYLAGKIKGTQDSIEILQNTFKREDEE